MKTLHELLAEAQNFGSSKPHKEEVVKTASSQSSVDELVNFLMSGGDKELTKEAHAEIKSSTISSEQELIEKLAESIVTIDTMIDLSLANAREGLIKEASVSGKTEKEVDDLILKMAKVQKNRLSGLTKAILGVTGLGVVGGGAGVAGHKKGYTKGRVDEFTDLVNTPYSYGGQGDIYGGW